MSNIIDLIEKLPHEKRAILEQQLLVDGSKYNVFPLSFAQKRLWFLDRFEANKAVYNIPSAYKITGSLNYDILEKAVNTIIERHEILRTIFIVIDQEPFQVINSDIKISIPIIGLSSEKEKENKIREILFKEASQHFNLSEGPLLSIKLLKVRKDQHIVSLTMHHIISDGWSMSILIKEVIALYNSFAKGEPSPLPPLKIQYADFAKWQNYYLQGEKFEEQFDYWKKKLKDIPQAINLPFYKPRLPYQSHNGNHLRFALPKELSTKLADLARQYDITLFMLMLAAFNVLLSKYSGQDDILIGTPIAGRNRPETESLIGFFINTLVLRTDLSANPTFEELLEQVKETSLGAFANQDLPFEKLIEAVQPERNLNIPPIFQVLFTFQNLPLSKVKVADLEFESVEVDNKTVKYDLTLSLEETPEGIRGGFGYNTDLFEKNTVEKMAVHFRNLLSEITEELTQRISEISILSEDEKNESLYEWNKTEKEYDLNNTIHGLFETQAKSAPDSIAIVQPPNSIEQQSIKEITYGELNSLSNKIANYVMAKGIKKGSIIGICYDRTIEQIASVLGILKAGCAYLPLDTKYPKERIEYMIDDSGTELVITHSKYKTKFGSAKKLILLAEVFDKVLEMPENTVSIEVLPDDLAYIIYTSGSTGKPKGVAVEHGNLVNYIFAAKEIFNLKKEDRVLQFASISFDAAAEEIYPTLTSGSTLVLRNDTMIGSSFAFVNSINELGITVLDLPTAYWHQLVSELEINNHTLPEQIRLVIIGGERAIPRFILKWQKKYSHIRLLNTYGPTETTVVATIWELPPISEKPPFTNEVPIGRPVPNVQAFVLNKYMKPVPIGVGGELFIGGAGVARGYLNREELTSEKFIINPFESNKTSRLYRTGDKVRFLKDGNIEFLGRLDHQVKIRGFRIELGEIENKILKYSGIKEAVLNTISNEQGEKSIIAYFVEKESTKISGSDIKKFLQKTLPDYMIPAFFVKVDSIPLTPSGKVDFKSLPDLSGSRPDLDKPYVKERNPLEKILVTIWKRTLQIDKIGVHDNFFELGGDSLKAAILINRLQQELDVILYVVILFDNQTIAELSGYLTNKYPEQVLRICKKYYPEENVDFIKSENVQKMYNIDEDMIQKAKRILSEKTADKKAEIELLKNIHTKLKRAIFIVSAPRSGSTLLRVILAGHSKLFSPPELALINFKTLIERSETFTGRDEGWMEGLYRAIMEIKNCDFQNSKEIVAEFEKKGYSTYQMYAKIQEWLGDKILVDKTTTYASNIDYLKRTEAYFDEPLYIQIVRHPAAMIQSYLDSNLEQVFGSELPFEAREKAELFWIINNRNILKFFETVPDRRRITIKYEEMVKNPDKVIKEICDKIGIEYEPVMIKPYQGKRMLDGVHKESKMVGDPRFNTHKEIDSSLANKWQVLPDGDKLNKLTIDVAEKLNYKIDQNNKPSQKLTIKTISRKKLLPLSFSQERLWFLDKMDPLNSAYNIPGVVKLTGELSISILKSTIQKIVDRHEILRSSIKTIDGKGYIDSVEKIAINADLVDLNNSNLSEQRVTQMVIEEIRKPFNLSDIPLFRIKIFKIKESEHIFILTMHHIISDGWSIGIFIKEFSEIYSSLLRQNKIQLPILKIQYPDYAHWQREYLKGDILNEQLDFWKKYLKGAPPLLNLPTDNIRPSIQTFNGAIKKFELPLELSANINKLCKEFNVTPFMFLLAVLQILLSKYSRQNDISTGIPVANRNRSEFESLIGFFVNTIVIRNKFNFNNRFTEVLKQIKKSVVLAFEHQEIPFEKIVDSLDIDRDVSHSPLFQVMFTYQNLPKTKIELPNLQLEAVELESNISKFDLSLTMMERQNGFEGGFEFNTDLFEETTIERMIEQFTSLLKLVTNQPNVQINQISLISNSEAKKIIAEINKSEEIPGLGSFVFEAFNNIAKQRPNKYAVIESDKKYTYTRLNSDSNKLANYLRNKGIRYESIIGVYLKRSYMALVSFLGILKAGAAYLPLDPNYPSARLDFMINDSEAKVILSDSNLINTIPNSEAEIIDLSIQWKNIDKEKDDLIFASMDSDNLAYIIYTSGSTGKPKGTLITHKGLINYLNWALYKYPIEKGKGSVIHSSLAFDATITAIYPALLSGKTLYIVSEEDEIENFKNILIKNGKFGLVKITPAYLDILSTLINSNETSNITHSFVIGGENLVSKQIKFWQENASSTLLFNEYGPTESVVGCIVYEASQFNEKGTVPIGRIISGTEAYILDSNLHVLPKGILGELYIGGLGLARGYKNRADLTAEKFIPNPFSNKKGERLYKTGDLVKFRNDGMIEFVGRIDSQIKLRGYRIELGEIKSILSSHSDIEQTVVIVSEDKPSNKKLVAYFTTDNPNLKNEDLEKYLSKTLPDYMIPSFFVKLDKIPLTPNGKVDRKALPTPEIKDTISTEEFTEPKTEKEIILAKVWEEVLGFDKIGLNDNFFKLGGDSIVAIQMIAKAKQKGLQITPVQIFQNQTLQKLAFVSKETNVITAEQGIVTGIAPLTPIQQYFFEHKLSEPNHWNQSIFLSVNEHLDENKLKESIRILLSHHDELRTKFEIIDGNWQQNILEPNDKVPFEIVDLTKDNRDSVKLKIEENNSKVQASLNIKTGSVIKVVYYKINNNESRILIVIHHLVMDGISWRILIEDIISAYNFLLANKEVNLPSKSTSFKTWAKFLNEFAASEKIIKEQDFWLKKADKTVTEVEKDFDGGENFEKSIFNKNIILNNEETDYLLKDIHEKYNTQINDILLSALLVAYSKWKGKRQLLINLEGHGREELSAEYDVSRTIGWFTSLFPVMMDMNDAVELGEIIKLVKENLRSIPNKGIGFGILRYLSPDSNLKEKLKIFDNAQITFNYLGQFDQSIPENSPFEVAQENKGVERGLENKRTSLIDVTVAVSQRTMSISMSASKNHFKQESIIEFLTYYKNSLQEIINHCKGNDKVEYTSSDFDLVDLENDQLNSVLDKLNNQDNEE